MKKWAVVILLLVAAPALSAPAPVPKHPRGKPAPGSPYWEIDFTRMTKAGQVNLGLTLVVKDANGNTMQSSIGQSGQVHVPIIVEIFSRRFDPSDLVIAPDKTHLTIKSFKGVPIRSVEIQSRDLAQQFVPVVLPPGPR